MTSLLDCDASGRGVWRFRLLNIPISVQPWFWLTIAIMCGRQDAGAAFIWIAVCFGSILIHEMGHALAFRAFGIASEVVLYAWGGLAIPKGRVRYGSDTATPPMCWFPWPDPSPGFVWPAW